MARSDRRSRDQKRKDKLKKRAERSHKHESLAYHGTKYQAAEFVPFLMNTETSLYETYVITERALTDDQVESALERLVLEMRKGPLPQLPGNDSLTRGEGVGEEELIVQNLIRHWKIYSERRPLPRRDDMIGVLRTILRSVEVWRSESGHSRGYLHYIEGFLKKAGVSVQLVNEDFEPIAEPDVGPLLELGRNWLENGDQTIAGSFRDQSEHLLRTGNAEQVIEVAQQLIGEADDPSSQAELTALALRGRQTRDRALD